MQLNELIEKEGIESVSNKTNISIENLENLQAGKFEKLNRVKSLGFVNIIERDYEIELEGLRAEIKTYFDDHHSAKDDEVVMLSPDRIEESNTGIFKWILILAVLYGLWYFFSHGKLDDLSHSESDQETALDDAKALESNVSSVVIEHVKVEPEHDRVVIDTSKKKVSKTAEEVSPELIASATEESTSAIKTHQQRFSLGDQTEEGSSRPKHNSPEMRVATHTVAPLLSDLNATDNMADEESESATPVAITNLTVNPIRGMLWFGFINIDTKKKKEFMTQSSTPFEIKDGRWILITGHGYLEIVSDLGTVKVTKNIRNKHYFYIDSQEIREIDRKEFRRLNGGHGW